MMLDRRSQRSLLEALDELKGGSSRRFEDRLWLGFGDGWTNLRDLLVRDQSVREIPGETPAYALLVKGEALRRRLIEALARSDGESASIGDSAVLARVGK